MYIDSGDHNPENLPTLVCDIDSVLVNPRDLNAMWLPGEPDPRTLPAEESEIARQYGYNINTFYRKKDDFLKSQEGLEVPVIKDSREVLAILALDYSIVFGSARIPGVHDATQAWLEKNYADIFQTRNIDLRTIGVEDSATYPSKQAIYEETTTAVMIDDRRSHHEEARMAGVATRIFFQEDDLGDSRNGSVPSGSKQASSFEQVLNLVPCPEGKRYNAPTRIS